jgi:hypothetical protein
VLAGAARALLLEYFQEVDRFCIEFEYRIPSLLLTGLPSSLTYMPPLPFKITVPSFDPTMVQQLKNDDVLP